MSVSLARMRGVANAYPWAARDEHPASASPANVRSCWRGGGLKRRAQLCVWNVG
jgi:hypothetical protein